MKGINPHRRFRNTSVSNLHGHVEATATSVRRGDDIVPAAGANSRRVMRLADLHHAGEPGRFSPND
jgi:hypothetical protein